MMIYRFLQCGGIGDRYLFQIDDEIIPFDMFYHKETWASDEMKAFIDLCKEKYGYDINQGGILLDIGANIGTTSIWMDIMSNGELEVHAFEAVPDTYAFLKANCAINGNRVKPHNIALSNTSGNMEMLIFPDNQGRNQILSDINRERFLNDRIVVKSERLDDFLLKQGINQENIRYIWIDVGGHEPAVVEGMRALLDNRKIPIFMEFSIDAMSYEQVLRMQEILSRTYDRAIAISTVDGGQRDIAIRNLCEFYKEAGEQYNLFLY